MNHKLNKLFKRDNVPASEKMDIDNKFDHELKAVVGTIQPAKPFESQLEARIMEISAQKQAGHTGQGQLHRAAWYQLNTPLKKFSLVGLIVVFIITISLLVSPSLRVMAEDIFNFWKKVDNERVVTPFPEITPMDPDEFPAIVDAIQQEMKRTQQATAVNSEEEEYIIKLPTLLPEGHRIVVVDRGPFGNAFLDLSRGRSGILMTVTIRPASEVQGKIIGPEDKVEKVTIDGITYEYVRGGWGIGNALSSQMDPDAVQDLSWIDDYDGNHKLRWFDGNMNYYMSVAGSSLPGHEWYLGMNDLVKIASSFQPLENGTRPPLDFFEPDHGIDEKSFENIKDISVLEDLVKFNIPEASFLPGDFHFTGGVPAFTGNHVIFSYSCTNDAISSVGMDEIGFQFSIGRYSESDLTKELKMFGGYEIGEDALIENILINNVEVQFVKGDWNYVIEERTWDNNQNHFKMVWYKDGLLYNVNNHNYSESFYLGSCALTKEDLIKFVEGLQ